MENFSATNLIQRAWRAIKRPVIGASLVGLTLPFLLLGLAQVALADKSPVVSKVRIGQHEKMTRVVLESDIPLTPKLFTLPNPPRVVLDLPESEFKQDLHNLTIPPGSIVKNMRQGLFKPGVTRVVLDMTTPAAVTKFAIPANGRFGHRLVLDLSGATKQSSEITAPKAKPAEIKQPTPIKRTPKTPGAPVVVVIDPGHGGVDPGAVTKSGRYEKNVVLTVSKMVRDNLRGNPDVRVYLTRDTDLFIPLSERVRIAQLKNADMFISIHADANNSSKVRGATVYTLSDTASDKEAARLARKANEGDLIAGVDMHHESKEVRDILIDLTQRETMNRSVYLGQSLLSEMKDAAYLRKSDVLFAGFRVLKAPDIPSALVELGYMSNPEEERLLHTRSHQQKLARAISDGILDFAKNHVHH